MAKTLHNKAISLFRNIFAIWRYFFSREFMVKVPAIDVAVQKKNIFIIAQ